MVLFFIGKALIKVIPSPVMEHKGNSDDEV
jgi:hypothetical protein